MYTSSYTPTYYSSLHDSITSICKNILPFSFKKRRLPAIVAAEHQLAKQQSDNLKWQQDSYHQILKLMGLCKEGILPEADVSAFKTHLLDTLVASPADHEQPVILRDKLVFLQELLHAKIISDDEYHSSKRPLLQRLAVQGAEIEARDVVVAAPKKTFEEGWSVIDLKDESHETTKESSHTKSKSKPGSAMKQIKGAASVFGFSSSNKSGKSKEDTNKSPTPNQCAKNDLTISRENPFWVSESETKSVLMAETVAVDSAKAEKRSSGEKGSKSGKKQWGFDGLKKWKRSDSEDEAAPLPLSERSDSEAFWESRLVSSPVGEGPDTKQIKSKLHTNGSSSDFFVDKVLADKIKKELSRIQAELNAKNPNVQFSNEQIEAISTRLPVDKADLRNFFPKSWCDRYGEVVLNVVRKEFKDHVGEMGSSKLAAREKPNNRSSKMWTTFEDDNENIHPNLFASSHDNNSLPTKQTKNYTPLKDDHKYTKYFKSTNPFFPDYDDQDQNNKTRRGSELVHDQNPFWNPRHG